MKWRVKSKCCDCPFADSGAGLHLRKSLGRGRWREILASLRDEKTFPCHKTTKYDDDEGEALPGTGLLCAGAIEWQEKHNVVLPQVVQVMQRLDRWRDEQRA
jgi:hypothetical protein